MLSLSARPSSSRWYGFCLPTLIFSGSTLLLCITQPVQAQTASYAPAARSATSSNTMIDSVVGNRHSPIKKQTAETGDLYHVAADGTVTAPNGLIVNPGCPRRGGGPNPNVRSQYRFGKGRRGKGFETVMIGVSREPAHTALNATPHNTPTLRRATLNASFGPAGVYVIPRPCSHEDNSDRTLISDAAASLAEANGNVFALAGNRDTVEDVDTTRHFLNGDVQLVSTPPLGPASGRVAP